jgi:hypothetical protein
MVGGCSPAVARVPGVTQWAETATIAFGRGNSFGNAANARDQRLSSSAFIGEP